jgi:4-amino-4-deoxy-L-arabinose transferase-like glycosyltransferase
VLVAWPVLALLWVVAARMLGPSDAWHQSQPATIAYTTDIIANGNWILPQPQGRDKATKPPLYNWLAVPMVRLMGLASEPAHKAPSLAALCLGWLFVVRLGRWLNPTGGGALGWLAGMCLVANYSFFKLGYLARPDMLLALWLLLGWCAGTVLLIDANCPGGPGFCLLWASGSVWAWRDSPRARRRCHSWCTPSSPPAVSAAGGGRWRRSARGGGCL